MVELAPSEAALLARWIEAHRDSPRNPWFSCIAVVLPEGHGFIPGFDCAPIGITDPRDLEALETRGVVNRSAASHTIRVVDVTPLGFAWYHGQECAIVGPGGAHTRSS